MGHKIISTILPILLAIILPIPAQAQIKYTINSSKDNDSVHYIGHQIQTIDYGIILQKSNYTIPSNKWSAIGVGINPKYKYNGIHWTGPIIINSITNNNNQYYYYNGDTTFTYNILKNLNIDYSIYGDIVTSPKALQNNIFFIGTSISWEWRWDKTNLVAAINKLQFTDNNIRKGYSAKVLQEILPRTNIYIHTKYHTNSIRSEYYNSPPNWQRTGFGISTKWIYYNTTIGGWIESTHIKTPDIGEGAIAWQFRIAHNINEELSITYKIGRDWSSGLDYYYHYNEISILINF